MRDICQDLDFTLVVEGIENQQQLQKLQKDVSRLQSSLGYDE